MKPFYLLRRRRGVDSGECANKYVNCPRYPRKIFTLNPTTSAAVLGDTVYGTQANREALKRLSAQRREEYLQRIPIEGKFGQGKNGYPLNYIRAKRVDTSCAWINSIFLVMNLLILLSIFFALCKRGVGVVRMPLVQVVERLVCNSWHTTHGDGAICSRWQHTDFPGRPYLLSDQSDRIGKKIAEEAVIVVVYPGVSH